MKRKTANRANQGNNKFTQKRLDCELFNGVIACAKIEKANKVIFVGKNNDVCIIDDGYCWIEMYPDNENYAVTTIFDDKGNIIEWYIDAVINCEIEKGIVCYDDLYLDLSVNSKGQWVMLDEDELLQARDDGELSQMEVDIAFGALAKFKERYLDNFENLKRLTKVVCDEFAYQGRF